MTTYQSALGDPGTRYATLGTPIGIILIEFELLLTRRESFTCAKDLMAFGIGATPFFGTNDGAKKDVCTKLKKK